MTYSVKVREHSGRCLIRFECPLANKTVSKTFNDFNDPLQKYEAEGVALKLTQALNNHTWEGDITPYLPTDVKARNKPLIEALIAKAGDRKNCAEMTVASKLKKYPPIKTASELKRWFDNQKCSSASKNRYKAAIGAVRPDLTTGIRKFKEVKPQPDPWQEHERTAICEAFVGTPYEHYVWGLFKTGMRPGEFKALTPDDFIKNSKGYLIRVTKTVGKNGAKDSTKTGVERPVPFAEADWLRLRDAVTANGSFYAGMNDENFRTRHWHPTLKKLKLKRKVPYTMRHTAISEYLQRGGSYVQAGKVFGNSGKTIEDHYAGLVGTFMTV